MKYRFILMIIVLMMFHMPTLADVPPYLNYQGVLGDAQGVSVPDGSYVLNFKLYDAANGGNALWSETRAVYVSNGVFSLMLGVNTPLNLSFDSQYWLGIAVGNDPELVPRTQLSSSAYSLTAKTVSDDGITTAKIADGAVTQDKLAAGVGSTPWTANGNVISYSGTAVGIRTANPTSTLTVQGNVDVKRR